MRRISIVSALMLGLTLSAAPVTSQPLDSVLTGLTFGATDAEGGDGPSVHGFALYRFTPHVAVGLDIGRFQALPARIDTDILLAETPFIVTPDEVIPPRIVEIPVEYHPTYGRSVTFAVTIRADSPRVWRVTLFGIAGGGLARWFEIDHVVSATSGEILVGQRGRTTRDYVGGQVMWGGGVSVLTFHGILMELDARTMRFSNQPDTAVTRVGGGVGYRF